jgi:hypothetical protein
MDSKFHHVKVVSDEVALLSSITNLGKYVKKIQCVVHRKRVQDASSKDPHLHLA